MWLLRTQYQLVVFSWQHFLANTSRLSIPTNKLRLDGDFCNCHLWNWKNRQYYRM